MTPGDRRKASAKICAELMRTHEFLAARSVGCYLALADEVQTERVILRAWRAQKDVFVPVTETDGTMQFRKMTPESFLCRNQFGIWEPTDGRQIAARQLDVVVTPVVAFDNQRHRVGMGGGYYDRHFHWLRNRRKWLRPKLIGVAFACQHVATFSPNPWDVSLYRVITETKNY